MNNNELPSIGPVKINIGHFQELTWIAEQAIILFLKDRFIMIIIHGDPRIGKTSYAIISSGQAYGALNKINQVFNERYPDNNSFSKIEIMKKKIGIYKEFIASNAEFEYDWDSMKEYMAFKPQQFIHSSRKPGKKPLIIVDDAGRWLNAKEHNNPFVRAVGVQLELVGSKWACVVFTCSNMRQLFAMARNFSHIWTIRILDISDDEVPQRRIAKIHEGWESEDMKKSGRTTRILQRFYAWLPDPIFNWYNPWRDSLQQEGGRLMEQRLKQLIESGESEYT